MALFILQSALQTAWPWTRGILNILRSAQPFPFAGSHLMFGSDYSGDHKESKFRTYCYLIVDGDHSPQWPVYRRKFRTEFLLDGRRMSFKGLNDGQRRRALVPFLETADFLNGHLVGLIVTKEVEFMSTSAQMLERWGTHLNLKGRWNKTSFKSVCRTALFSLYSLVCGLNKGSI